MEASADHSSDFRTDYRSRDGQNGVWEPSWGQKESEGLEAYERGGSEFQRLAVVVAAVASL